MGLPLVGLEELELALLLLLLELTGLLLELELLELELATGLLLELELELLAALLELLDAEAEELPSMVLEGSGNSGVVMGSLLSLLEKTIEPEPLMMTSPWDGSEERPHPAEAKSNANAVTAANNLFMKIPLCFLIINCIYNVNFYILKTANIRFILHLCDMGGQ